MAASKLIATLLCVLLILALGFLFWRYVWFFRNPARKIPTGQNIVSPADGTVVYVKELEPAQEVIVIKKGVSASINDIVREDVKDTKILIGIFMSPFNVHYNRSPISGKIDFIRHHPPKSKNLHMGSMHFRTLMGWNPLYKDSLHIIENERTVTRISGEFKGHSLPVYVVQIAAKNVNGIDSYKPVGQTVDKGEIFGMIRIGSQVDLIIPSRMGMNVLVRAGDSVKAGETILIN